ncbi:hypothetical protein [Brevibacterium casei]|uniref:hypothetical protein n=1 Tax=Brevibacterium casei TaxID=33889 RepID=UPI001140B82E|nr:hypothetical protein [Brevibacterium casei]
MRPLVKRLGYVTAEAADPEGLVRDTAEKIGAREVGRTDDGRILMSSNRRHAEYIVQPADGNRHAMCGLEAVSADAIDEVRRRCEQAGLEVITTTPSLSVIEKSVTFATSEGQVFEVHTPMPHDRAQRYAGPGMRPKTLDHVNFTAADPERWAHEMNLSCGFLLSQRSIGHEIAWMRAADGRHHTVAVVQNEVGGLHHTSWEFNSFDDFRGVADSLIPEERRLTWGPGRHGAGDNLFLYFKNTSDFLIECIAEMEVIDDVYAEPRVVDPGENLSNWKLVDLWGSRPPIEWVQQNTPLAPESSFAR